MSILSGMDGKSAMPNGLHAKHVLFTVSVPLWEVLTLKKQLSQVYSRFYQSDAPELKSGTCVCAPLKEGPKTLLDSWPTLVNQVINELIR